MCILCGKVDVLQAITITRSIERIITVYMSPIEVYTLAEKYPHFDVLCVTDQLFIWHGSL